MWRIQISSKDAELGNLPKKPVSRTLPPLFIKHSLLEQLTRIQTYIETGYHRHRVTGMSCFAILIEKGL
jgi:hypothetical protein